AVPSCVAQFTVTNWLLGAERVTVKTAGLPVLLPSGTEILLMEIMGGTSSLRIVHIQVSDWINALLACKSRTANVSSGSTNRSPMMETLMVCSLTPGEKV